MQKNIITYTLQYTALQQKRGPQTAAITLQKTEFTLRLIAITHQLQQQRRCSMTLNQEPHMH